MYFAPCWSHGIDRLRRLGTRKWGINPILLSQTWRTAWVFWRRAAAVGLREGWQHCSSFSNLTQKKCNDDTLYLEYCVVMHTTDKLLID
jgi:hypothetical protein